MVVKMKLFWKIFAFFFFACGGTYVTIERFIQYGFFNVKNWILLIGTLMFIFFAIFLFPTAKIIFDKRKIQMYWKICFGSFILYERKNLYINYKDVIDVSSFLPSWFPVHIITVAGRGFFYFFGIMLTKKKETFALLAQKINPNDMDKGARKILFKYNKKYGKLLKEKYDI